MLSLISIFPCCLTLIVLIGDHALRCLCRNGHACYDCTSSWERNMCPSTLCEYHLTWFYRKQKFYFYTYWNLRVHTSLHSSPSLVSPQGKKPIRCSSFLCCSIWCFQWWPCCLPLSSRAISLLRPATFGFSNLVRVLRRALNKLRSLSTNSLHIEEVLEIFKAVSCIPATLLCEVFGCWSNNVRALAGMLFDNWWSVREIAVKPSYFFVSHIHCKTILSLLSHCATHSFWRSRE